ncbi:MAG: CDGSH iron-sulfur domain-containing protein [Xanthomonadaceae bacterium]|nr:CDGSH iron-sulfur domain-containing protein [Xanthomonadaceae bacterium]
MSQPHVAQAAPYVVDVEAEKTYWWCACGLSKDQPFCDGSHKRTDLVPIKYVAERSERLWFCGCKHSADAPLCDGTHRKLTAGT